jgi:superfamily I DNA/RNA helicase
LKFGGDRQIATKGQEWKHVVLVGCDEEMLSHRTAMKGKSSDNPWLEAPLPGALVEEERRLCYVAFARAKERLDIFYDSTNPSRFINEAGLKLEHD